MINGNLNKKTGKRDSPPFSYFTKHHDDAYKYGRTKEHAANQKMIANLAYADKNRSVDNRVGNTQEDDGWNFRGKGLIQLTGRENYTKANAYTLKYEKTDILKNPDIVSKDIKIAVLTSMAFFKWRGLIALSNGSSESKPVSQGVGHEVGNSYILKQNAFDNYTSKLFKVIECDWKNIDIKIFGKRAPWMEIALSEAKAMKGCLESDNPMYSKAKEYLSYCKNTAEPTNGEQGAWCAAFMNWCISKSKNAKTKLPYSHSKSASSLAPIGNSKYKKISEPIYGCFVVYRHTDGKHGHTGLLYGKNKNGKYILLGGNQSNSICFSEYGEYTSKSKQKKLYGFYIPADYIITDIDNLNSNDIYSDIQALNRKIGIKNKQDEKTN